MHCYCSCAFVGVVLALHTSTCPVPWSLHVSSIVFSLVVSNVACCVLVDSTVMAAALLMFSCILGVTSPEWSWHGFGVFAVCSFVVVGMGAATKRTSKGVAGLVCADCCSCYLQLGTLLLISCCSYPCLCLRCVHLCFRPLRLDPHVAALFWITVVILCWLSYLEVELPLLTGREMLQLYERFCTRPYKCIGVKIKMYYVASITCKINSYARSRVTDSRSGVWVRVVWKCGKRHVEE